MPRVGFEPTISEGERPKTYALDRAATGTGKKKLIIVFNLVTFSTENIYLHGLRRESYSVTDRVLTVFVWTKNQM